MCFDLPQHMPILQATQLGAAMNDFPYEPEVACCSVNAVIDSEWSAMPMPSPIKRNLMPEVGPELGQLIHLLPMLGTVLWLERRHRSTRADDGESGMTTFLLPGHPVLRTLTRCRDAIAQSAITPQGPRESLCLRDADGEIRARMFLLPDTDYLVWDELTAGVKANCCSQPAPRWHAHSAFLRSALARLGFGWNARLLSFELRGEPWLRRIDARPPLRISLLGLEVAQNIARAEGAELVTPLHTA